MLTRRQEFRQHWPLLVGVVVSGLPISVPLYATGVLMPLWEAEYGWKRSQIAFAISCYMFALAVASPVIGRIVDRYGVRRPLLVSLVGGVAAVAGLSTIGSSLWSLYLRYFVLALVSSACIPATLTRPVSAHFDRARGLAFGITLSATTISMLATPMITFALTVHFGWRRAFQLIACGLSLLLPLAAWGLWAEADPTTSENASNSRVVEGARLSGAIRVPAFWLMTLSFFLTVFVSTGTIGQIVPILVERGITPQAAVLMQPAVAAGLGISRIFIGTALDRINASRIYLLVCSTASFGLMALSASNNQLILPAILLIGAVLGAEFDILAFIVSRYFGLREYSQIFGWIYVANIVGAMLGPIYLGMMHDLFGSYRIALQISAALLVLAGLMTTPIRSYPHWTSDGKSRKASAD